MKQKNTPSIIVNNDRRRMKGRDNILTKSGNVLMLLSGIFAIVINSIILGYMYRNDMNSSSAKLWIAFFIISTIWAIGIIVFSIIIYVVWSRNYRIVPVKLAICAIALCYIIPGLFLYFEATNKDSKMSKYTTDKYNKKIKTR